MATHARVLIVDDHPLVRAGLAARIEMQPDLKVCGEAEDVDDALILLASKRPTLVIVDITLKRGHGLNLIKQIVQRSPDVKVLVVSAHDESLFAERALRAGALGYVNKQAAQRVVIDAIRTVLRGERYISDEMTGRLVRRAVEHRSPHGIESLSNRELEVFELIGRGNNTRSIAQQLSLSIHTIESHRENIRAKLELDSGSELVREAVQWVLETH